MGTFEGHILPGIAFVVYGAWHLVSAVRRFRAKPKEFHSQAWWPSGFKGWLKYLELLLLIIASLTSISMELILVHPHFTPFNSDGTLPSSSLVNFEHSSISFFFLLFALASIVVHAARLPWQISHVFGAAALGIELMVFLLHSADHMGLEGHYHSLLSIPIIIGILCAVSEMLCPREFILSVVRSSSFVLQGVWLSQMAFSIWVPSLWPLHCVRNERHIVVCDSEEWDHRGKAIANLLFVLWTAAVLVSMLAVVVFMLRGQQHAHAHDKGCGGYTFMEVEMERKVGKDGVSEGKALLDEESH